MNAAIAAIAGIGIGFFLLVAAIAVIGIAYQCAICEILRKAGEVKSWKGIIPVYSTFLLFRYVWSTKAFWIYLLFGVIAIIGAFLIPVNVMLGLIVIVGFLVALVVMSIMFTYKMCKSFGHGAGWTIGLILLNTIFTLMLAFGKSEYRGNAYLER